MMAPLRWTSRIMTLTKLMIVGQRQPLLRTPAVVGLDFEEVEFHSTDGVTLRGWFIPHGGDGPGPAVVFVHGWLWNRHGNTPGHVPSPTTRSTSCRRASARWAARWAATQRSTARRSASR
jgi:hypothetical protein